MVRLSVIGRAATAALLAAPIVYFLVAGKPRPAAGQGDPVMPPGGLALDAPLPDNPPSNVVLSIGDPTTQKVLQATGWDRALPFKIRWARIAGGPAVTEAFHARALDVGASADIPPIHAVWVGMPVKIIAVIQRRDPAAHPAWVIATGPRSGIATLEDLRGKRIAFSPGQVQGEVVLRTLAARGLTKADVRLVEMPSTSADVYINALASGQIDAAPIANLVPARKYLEHYGPEGARLLEHPPFRDDLVVLYVRTETLQDPQKAAALKAYVALWARAQAWIDSHPDDWARLYYQGDQGLKPDDARYVVKVTGAREVPADWSPIVRQQQGAIDLLAQQTGQKSFPAETIFDRRFEPVAAGSFAAAVQRP